MAIIGYARAGITGQSLEEQLEKLKSCDKIYREKKGAGEKRPQLEACLKKLGEGDTLVVTRLDRLARSTTHLYRIAEILDAKRATLRVIDQNIDGAGETGRSFAAMLDVFREFETTVRAEHQAQGLKKARQRGARIGVPKKLSAEQIASLRQRKANGESYQALSDEFGLSRSSIYRYLQENRK